MNWLRKIWNYFKSEPEVQPSLPPVEQDVVVIDVDAQIEDSLITNDLGLKLCAESEGLHKRVGEVIYPYKDPIGIPTIGRGTIKYPNGKRVTMQDRPISIHEADEYFRHEMNEKENVLEAHLKKHNISLNTNEFSALVSFAYNLGYGVVTSQSYTMGRALISEDRKRIADAFLLYDKATKRTFGIKRKVRLRGLTIRRNKERALFLKKV